MEDKIGFKVDGTRIVVDAELLMRLVNELTKLSDRVDRLYQHIGLRG